MKVADQCHIKCVFVFQPKIMIYHSIIIWCLCDVQLLSFDMDHTNKNFAK